MRKITMIILCMFMFVGCAKKEEEIQTPTSEMEVEEDVCVLAEDDVCFSEGTYEIEHSAQIKLGNLPIELQEAIIELWDKTYPREKGLIVLNEVGEINEEEIINSLLNEDDIDIIYADEKILTYYLDHLYEIHEEIELDKSTEYTVIIENYFVPYTVEGIAFLTNKTMLESIGVNVEDANNDGLIDAVDDFDKIFTLAARNSYDRLVYKQKEITTFFPFCFNEHTLSYFMISSGFELYPTLEGDKPGFDSEEFKTALSFIYNAGKFPLAQKKLTETIDGKKVTSYIDKTADELVWEWEKVYNDESAPFGIVTSWMDIDTAMEHNKIELVVSKFPTYQGNTMKPLVSYQGFAIEDDTDNPSAAHAVLDFLMSEAVMQLFLDHSDKLVYMYDDMNLTYENINRYNYNKSLMEAKHLPLLGLPDNMYVEAMSYYYEGAYMDILKELYDHKINVAEAQKKFTKSYSSWYKEKTSISSLKDELSKN